VLTYINLTQFIVDISRGNGAFGGCDEDLIKSSHHIACRIEPGYGSLLVRIDDQGAMFVAARIQTERQLVLRAAA
jgi:hypothetical protein